MFDIHSLSEHPEFPFCNQNNLKIKTNREASIIRKCILESFDASINYETDGTGHQAKTKKGYNIGPQDKHIISSCIFIVRNLLLQFLISYLIPLHSSTRKFGLISYNN